MSRLTPDTQYIFENDDGVIYAREFGKTERIEIGRTSHRVEKDWSDEALWKEILIESRNNPALQQELERVKIFYLLSKKQNQSTPHHSV
jgi:hypothetical protein